MVRQRLGQGPNPLPDGRISDLSVELVAAGVEIVISDGFLDGEEVTQAAASPELAGSLESVLQLTA